MIWGLVGPKRLYSVGKIYSGLLHFFWIGALMPILTWAAWKYTKKDWIRKINWPLIFSKSQPIPRRAVQLSVLTILCVQPEHTTCLQQQVSPSTPAQTRLRDIH